MANLQLLQTVAKLLLPNNYTTFIKVVANKNPKESFTLSFNEGVPKVSVVKFWLENTIGPGPKLRVLKKSKDTFTIEVEAPEKVMPAVKKFFSPKKLAESCKKHIGFECKLIKATHAGCESADWWELIECQNIPPDLSKAIFNITFGVHTRNDLDLFRQYRKNLGVSKLATLIEILINHNLPDPYPVCDFWRNKIKTI